MKHGCLCMNSQSDTGHQHSTLLISSSNSSIDLLFCFIGSLSPVHSVGIAILYSLYPLNQCHFFAVTTAVNTHIEEVIMIIICP